MSERSLGEPFGGVDNLYTWGDDQLIKLFGDEAPEGWVEHMSGIDRALHAAGLPVPAAGECVEIDGRLGLTYERIDGDAIANYFLGPTVVDPGTVVELAHVFAEVHAEIHACGSIPGLPSQKQVLHRVIQSIAALPSDLKEATLRALAEMPAGDRLCHGDFHPYNVLMSPRGPVVIDWNNAVIGNPLADVSRTALILSGVSEVEPSLGSMVSRFTAAYLQRYSQLRPFNQQELVAWQPIVAAVRLSDNIPELQEWLLTQIKAGLGLWD